MNYDTLRRGLQLRVSRAIDTYAGLNGWDVPQIYNRAVEDIGKLQEQERAKHGQSGEGHAL